MDMAAVRTRVAVSVTDVTEHPIPMLIIDQGAEADSTAATALFKSSRRPLPASSAAQAEGVLAY